MATITVRNLDEDLKKRLRIASASHGHSMEEEVRRILRQALAKPEPRGLGSRIRARFAVEGGVELGQIPRSDTPKPADFDS